jgi:Protein of unknown function (DUF4235)
VANPLLKIVVPVAGVLASIVGNKAVKAGWGAVFGEDAPSAKAAKASRKDTAQRRKQAKKDGLPASEIREIKDPTDDQPIWKALLWALVSGVILQGLKLMAQRGAKAGTERLTSRRPRTNRG